MNVKLKEKGIMKIIIKDKNGNKVKELIKENTLTNFALKLMTRSLIFDDPNNYMDGETLNTETVFRNSDRDANFILVNNQVTKILVSNIAFENDSSLLDKVIERTDGFIIGIDDSKISSLGSNSNEMKKFAIKIQFELTNDSQEDFDIRSIGLLSDNNFLVSLINFFEDEAYLRPGDVINSEYNISLNLAFTNE